MIKQDKTFGLGLIGCGGFGRFCLESFSRLPQVRIVAAAEPVRSAAQACAAAFDIPVYPHAYELIARDDIDIVHIATPPSTHRELALECCVAHKHVLCEKPLAMTVQQADEMLDAARKCGIIMPVNFVLRYNAVTEKVKELLDSQLLGEVLAARLTNCATDSKLPTEHWFWDKGVSGGIFIEHGVHFFDLYRYWFGDGQVINAVTTRRPRTGQEDRVTCTVKHESGVLASHYHAFDQLLTMDRTDHRILFELGEITVGGWIPLSITVDATLGEEAIGKLHTMLPGAAEETLRDIEPAERVLMSRNRQRHSARRVRLHYEPENDKTAVYARGVCDLLTDQLEFLRDPKHVRRIDETNGHDSVVLAQAAASLAVAQEETAKAAVQVQEYAEE